VRRSSSGRFRGSIPARQTRINPCSGVLQARRGEGARLLGFHIYVSEDRSSEVVIQIHPDAASMQHHLEAMGDKVRETFAFADFESLEIYGEPNDALRGSGSRA
jgi:hypothetical protein